MRLTAFGRMRLPEVCYAQTPALESAARWPLPGGSRKWLRTAEGTGRLMLGDVRASLLIYLLLRRARRGQPAVRLPGARHPRPPARPAEVVRVQVGRVAGVVRAISNFSINYYLTAMLFIVFDIEIVYIYPLAVILEKLGTYSFVELCTVAVGRGGDCGTSTSGGRVPSSGSDPARPPCSGGWARPQLEDVVDDHVGGEGDGVGLGPNSVGPFGFGLGVAVAMEMIRMITSPRAQDVARFGSEVVRPTLAPVFAVI